MTFDQISLVLMEQAGSKFDRGVVSALLNYVDNRGGSARWEHFQEAPRETGHPPSAPPYGDHPRPEIVVRSA
jgi:hypothetical protein